MKQTPEPVSDLHKGGGPMWDPNVDFVTGSWIGWMILVSAVMLVAAAVRGVYRALFGKSRSTER